MHYYCQLLYYLERINDDDDDDDKCSRVTINFCVHDSQPKF